MIAHTVFLQVQQFWTKSSSLFVQDPEGGGTDQQL
jgi:hypothetical protein